MKKRKRVAIVPGMNMDFLWKLMGNREGGGGGGVIRRLLEITTADLVSSEYFRGGGWEISTGPRSRRITGAYPSLLETEVEILGIQLSDIEMGEPVVEINP